MKPHVRIGHRVVDAGGRPVFAYFHGREYRVRGFIPAIAPLPHLPGKPGRVGRAARITLAGTKSRVLAREVYIPVAGAPMTIMTALRTPGSTWWVGERGVLERVATVYEEWAFDKVGPPRAGWRLVPATEAAAMTAERRANVGAPVGELDEEHELRSRLLREKNAEKRLDHARAMLTKAETRVRRATTIAKKWKKRVRALERKKEPS